MDRSSWTAPAALVVGGVLSAVLFVPFTLAHGPTSYNVENEVLGADMHGWGFAMGTVPYLLIGAGVWRLRPRISGDRRTASTALAVACAAMFLFAAMNLAFRAIGPPFDLMLLAPAMVVAALTSPGRGPVRAVLAALALTYCVALVIALVPQSTSDDYAGYRVFGAVAYAGVGLLWAALGTWLLRSAEGLALATE